MSDDLERRLQLERDRISQLETRQLPVMTAGEQTRLSWARSVESHADLPQFYRPFMDELIGSRPFPYAVLTPTYVGFMRRENEKLIFTLDDRIWVIERTKGGLRSVKYALSDIHYVEVGAILLDSWIKLSGVTDGVLTTSHLRFNTVTDRLFAPFIRQLRPDMAQSSGMNVDAERSKFDYLMALNYKFMNYARNSILPGEVVVCPMLQPEIRAQIISLFGHSLYRTVALTQIHILTDQEWIIIRDDEHSSVSHGHIRHGGVWTYLPLHKIAEVTLAPHNDDVLDMYLCLPHDDEIVCMLAVSKRPEIDSFLNQLHQVAPHIQLTEC